MKCRCHCNLDAVYCCVGFDFDPSTPDGRGAPFVEYACTASAYYLRDSSAELGFPFTMTRLEMEP